MQIDFFTLGAQLLNFIILVYLLKRFLFGRIIQAMDNRQDRINSQLEEAGSKKKEAEQEAESLRAKQRELEEERGKILDQARREAEDQRREMLNKARGEVEAEQARWKEALRGSRETFFRDLREHIGKESLLTARKVLRDLSGDDLERRIAESFAGRLRDMDESSRNELRQSMERAGRRGGHPERRESSGGCPGEDHRGGAGNHRLPIPPYGSNRLRRSSTDVEMRVNGSKVAWSFGSYLDDLEERIGWVYDSGAGDKGDTESGKRVGEPGEAAHRGNQYLVGRRK